ncbi:MAG: hypothetical protein HYS13_02280 [Planctomycetia bacterium]|nr:hypothetical protein [Planctomycetia bacterium]
MRAVPDHLPCFGRKADLDRLAERVSRRGVTFVMAPPRMGKTWLVRNLAFRRLQPPLAENWSVGYAESTAGKNDLVREAIADLYKRWLHSAGTMQQARSLLDRHRRDLVGKVGVAVGRMLGKVVELIPGGAAVSGLVDEALNGLRGTNEDLKSGGLVLEPIAYDDAHALVSLISRLRGGPVLLIMDAWERGERRIGDRGTIQKMLANMGDWPDRFHLLVAIRDLLKHAAEVTFADDCCRQYPDAASCEVGELQLHAIDEADALYEHLRRTVPRIDRVERNWAVEQFCQFPAVVEWWVKRHPERRDDFESAARDARNNKYTALCERIKKLSREDGRRALKLLKTTILIALLPEMTSPTEWQDVQANLGWGQLDAILLELQQRQILSPRASQIPSFGDTTAKDAVYDFIMRKPRSASRRDLRPLVKNVAERMSRALRKAPAQVRTVGLLALQPAIDALGLSEVYRRPGQLAAQKIKKYESMHRRLGPMKPARLNKIGLNDQQVYTVWVTFRSPAGAEYTAVHVFEHPSGPYVLLSSHNKNHADFATVQRYISDFYRGRLEDKVTDRGSDICMAIHVEQRFSLASVAQFAVLLRKHRFRHVVASKVYYDAAVPEEPPE